MSGRHAFPYSVAYDGDRERDGRIPRHRAAVAPSWDVFDVRTGRPVANVRSQLAARLLAKRGAWLDYDRADPGADYQH